MRPLAWVLCALRGRGHSPVRYILGGFRCSVCELAGADLSEMGDATGYVAPLRRTFERSNGGMVTRTSDWTKERVEQ